PLSNRIIGMAIEVHRHLGPGLMEYIYEAAMCSELRRGGVPFDRQRAIDVCYKGELIGICRADLIVDRRIVVEVKSVAHLDPVFDAQVLTYLRLTGLELGLMINFNRELLRHGIRRLILTPPLP